MTKIKNITEPPRCCFYGASDDHEPARALPGYTGLIVYNGP